MGFCISRRGGANESRPSCVEMSLSKASSCENKSPCNVKGILVLRGIISHSWASFVL